MKKTLMRAWILLTICWVYTPPVLAQTVEAGKKVSFDYNLSVEDQLVETTDGKRPIEYTHGEGQIIPGLEKAMAGMKVGEEKTVTIPPEDGYGDVIDDAIKDIPKSNFPEDFQFELGSIIQLEDPEGNAYPGIIWELKEDAIAVNFNHPLAGQTLNFTVKIVSIE